jgi:hypothetical protein
MPRICVYCLFVLFHLTGCGSNLGNKDVGAVSGKITYKGESVAGRITFHPVSGGDSVSAITKADGTYLAIGVPAGECKITVDTSLVGAVSQADASGSGSGSKKNYGNYGGNLPPEIAAKLQGGGQVQKTPEIPAELRPGTPEYERAKQYIGSAGANPLKDAKKVNIPLKYNSVESTDLTVKVRSKEQKHDVELVD